MNVLDLSTLPVPDVIETLDFETEFANRMQMFRDAMGDQYSAALESDPVVEQIQLFTYEILTLRARVNAAARAVLLASSKGNDLDNLLALLGAERLEGEPDPAYKERGRQAPYGFSTAGPLQAYKYHALSAHEDIRDARVDSPEPGLIRITVLSRVGDGVPTAEVLAAVVAKLSPEDMRPTSDTVLVEAAHPIPWVLHAEIQFPSGAAYEPVMEAAQLAAEAYALKQQKINTPIKRSIVISTLGLPGVSDVIVPLPAIDVAAEPQGAPYCAEIVLKPKVVYE